MGAPIVIIDLFVNHLSSFIRRRLSHFWPPESATSKDVTPPDCDHLRAGLRLDDM